MQAMLDLVTSWPTAIYTTLLGVVVLYWIVALSGLVDFSHGHGGLDFHHHADWDGHGNDLSTIATYAVAFGLNGVPLSVVLSLLSLLAWMFTGLAAQHLLPLVASAPLRAAAGLLVALLALVPAIAVTAWVARPLRRLFVQHAARSQQSVLGRYCRVTTLTVSESFGQGEAIDDGGSFSVRICAAEPNRLGKGSRALILEYDEDKGRFRVEAADDPL